MAAPSAGVSRPAMKRWLLVVLLGLAVLVLLAPGLIGMLAERSIERQLELAGQQQPELDVRTVRFERGWFTSDGRHRLPLTDPAVADLLCFVTPGADDPAAARVLILTTRIGHGPLPVAGADRGMAGLVPALATGVSTLELELDDGRRLPVPGTLLTRVTLTGTTTLDYRLPAGEGRREDFSAGWQQAAIEAAVSADGRRVDFRVALDAAVIEDGAQRAAVDTLAIAGRSEPTAWGYALGGLRVEVGAGTLNDGSSQVGWQGLAVVANADAAGSSVAAGLDVAVDGMATAQGDWSLRLDAAARLDGDALGPLLRGLQRGLANGGGLAPYTGIEADALRLAAAGGRLELPGFALDTPRGQVTAALDLALPQRDAGGGWPGIALGANARAELVLPRTLLQEPALREQLQALLAGGFLVPDGDNYRLQASLEQGIATINGAPLPLPLQQL